MSCAVGDAPREHCCPDMQPVRPSTCGSGCEASLPREKMCSEAEKTGDDQGCGQKPDCKSRANRLLPPLLAEGPNRVVSPQVNAAVSSAAVSSVISFEDSYTIRLDTPPPRGVHLGIATTVLRI